MKKPSADILFDDAGVLVYYADGGEALKVAMCELVDNGYTPAESREHMERLKPVTGYWRKVPPSTWLAEEGYGWVLYEAKKGPGAFYGTWFR